MQRKLNAFLAGLAGVFAGGGLIATIWTFDWRYVAIGITLSLIVALIAGQLLMNKDQR